MIRFVAGKLLHVDTVTHKVTDRSEHLKFVDIDKRLMCLVKPRSPRVHPQLSCYNAPLPHVSWEISG